MGAAETLRKEQSKKPMRASKKSKPKATVRPKRVSTRKGSTSEPTRPKLTAKEHIEQEFMKPNPALDRKIIEGMLNDRKALMNELCVDGVSQEMVMKRAGECGVSESLLRQMVGIADDLAGGAPEPSTTPFSLRARQCLSCERVFLSMGPGNRMCPRCRGQSAGLGAL